MWYQDRPFSADRLLDLGKHPVTVVDVITGAAVMHFTNYMCAARTVAKSKTDICARELAVKGPEGKHYDYHECRQDEVDWDFAHLPLKGETRW